MQWNVTTAVKKQWKHFGFNLLGLIVTAIAKVFVVPKGDLYSELTNMNQAIHKST